MLRVLAPVFASRRAGNANALRAECGRQAKNDWENSDAFFHLFPPLSAME
jgi:hypothetical protein